MATKSILKTIHIKKRKSALSLVNALENASGKSSKDVHYQRSYSYASKEDVEKIFGSKEEENAGIQNR